MATTGQSEHDLENEWSQVSPLQVGIMKEFTEVQGRLADIENKLEKLQLTQLRDRLATQRMQVDSSDKLERLQLSIDTNLQGSSLAEYVHKVMDERLQSFRTTMQKESDVHDISVHNTMNISSNDPLDFKMAGVGSDSLTHQTTFSGAWQEDKLHIEQSVWEALVAVGYGKIGFAGGVAIVVGIIISMMLQVLFCFLVQTDTFTTDPFPALRDVVKWRMTEGHSHLHKDPIMGATLVARVCNYDDSLTISKDQLEVWHKIRSYQDPVPRLENVLGQNGEVLCVLAMFLFTLVVTVEFQRALHFCYCFVKLPSGPKTHFSLEKHTVLVVDVLGRGHLMMIFCITSLRLAIAAMLVYSGNTWLAHTKDVENLVLNAVALCFIFDIDELVFRSFLPVATQIALTQIECKPVRVSASVKGLCMPAMSLIGVAGIVAYFYLTIVAEGIRKMDEIVKVMCGDNLDFAYAPHPRLNVLLMHSTPGFDARPAANVRLQDFLETKVAEGIKTPAAYDGSVKRVMWYGSAQKFEEFLSSRVEDFAKNLMCYDDYYPSDPNNESPYDAVTSVMYVQPDGRIGKDCASIKHNCQDEIGQLLRGICPKTCGCASPRSGLVRRRPKDGCPESCSKSEEHATVLERLGCEDPSAEELNEIDEWREMFPVIAQTVKNQMIGPYLFMPFWSKVFGDELVEQTEEVFLDLIRKQGCAHIAEMSHIFCDDKFFSNIRAFCPHACGCKRTMSDCPKSCPL